VLLAPVKRSARSRGALFMAVGFGLVLAVGAVLVRPAFQLSRVAQHVQDNCVACHAEMVSELVHGSTTDQDAVRCVHCHRGVGHGARN